MRPRQVLIVEDDPRFRNVIKRGLKDSHYIFFEAQSVLEGITELEKNPNIGVVLLDLGLPDGSGTQLLKHIKESLPKNRVIILTAHEEQLASEKARDFSVFNYLPKANESFTQSIRFSVDQAFKDIERELLKDKTEVLIEIQKRIMRTTTLEDLSDVLNVICQSVRSLVGVHTCHIRLYNLEKGEFDLAAFDGPSDQVRAVFMSSPKRRDELFSGKVAQTKTPVVFRDFQNDAEFKAFRDQSLKRIELLHNDSVHKEAQDYFNTIQSAFVVPITTRMFADEVDAVFNASGDSVDFFSQEKQELIGEFVNQATLAITKAWQKQRKQESHRDYKGISRVLEDISKELGGEDVKHQIYDIAIKGISDIIKPETVSIFLHNKSTGLLHNEAEFIGRERVEPRQEGQPRDEGLTGYVYSTGGTLRIPNLQEGNRSKPQVHEDFSKDLETDYVGHIPSGRLDHYLGVPMIVGDEVIGVIQLLNKKSGYYRDLQTDKNLWLLERGFSDDEETFLGIAASHVALAIKNAELIEERSTKISQLETLKDVGRYTSAEMPLGELLERIIQEAARDLRAGICLLFLMDEGKTKVVLEQSYGISKEVLSGAYYVIGEGMTGEVARSGHSGLVRTGLPTGKYDKEIETFLEMSYKEHKVIESLMVVPVKAKNELLGVIKVINKKGGEQFNDEDLSFLEAFANYVGIAIENAQRYEFTNRKLAIAEQNAGLANLVRAVVHEINNTQALIPVNIQLIRDRISRSDYDIVEMLDVIEDSAQQGVTFANSIQAFGASRLGEKEIQDINPLIQKAIHQLAATLSDDRYKSVQLEEKLSFEPLECAVYETPLIRVIKNIILNAYQAMELSEKGVLTITTIGDSNSGKALVAFTDSGPGINSAFLDKIFDPNFTTKKQGSGIGLWLAKTHLSIIDANIAVRSVVNEGTTFTIEIPLAQRTTAEKRI